MTETKTRNRLRVLGLVFVIIFSALTTRLWFLQVLATEQFAALADQNQIRDVVIEPVRGKILDRNGDVLVDNRASLVVTVDRKEIEGREDEVLPRLAQILHLPLDVVVERVESVRYAPYQPVPVAEDVPKEIVFYIEERPELFPGVDYELSAVREYPNGSLAAHVLGYVGEISSEQLEGPAFGTYGPGETVGKAGVESSYEEYLFGTRGTRYIQVNAQGDVLDPEFHLIEPVRGGTLVLTIDTGIQQLVEESLLQGIQLARRTFDENTERNFEAPAAAAVVMDPRNGQVLAIASYPTFDPSLFVGGLSAEDAAQLGDPELAPQLNRAIQGQYPPGSTFKPFVAAGALHRHYASLTGGYECPPEFEVEGDANHTIFHNWSPIDLGTISLAESLVVSCDTVFYRFGEQYWRTYAGTFEPGEPMQEDLLGMGFGARTGIDLPGEAPGRIPTAEYKFDIVSKNPSAFGKDAFPFWVPGDNVLMAIGQGFVTATPLQVAMAYSAIANGGTLYEPHVALRVDGADGNLMVRVDPEPIGKLPLTKRQVTALREALMGVPVEGTAEAAFAGFPFDVVPVAGKTGTAEVIPKQDYSWFACMAPAGDPQYVVAVLVEQGGHGAQTAAPVARRILEGLFGLESAGELVTGEVSD